MGGKVKERKKPKRLTWCKWEWGPPGYKARFGGRMAVVGEVSRAEIVGWYRASRGKGEGK